MSNLISGKTANSLWQGRDTASARPPLFLSALLLAVFAITGFICLRSDYFCLREIVIEGNERLSAEELTTGTGLECGVNIWQIDLRRLERNLRQNRLIKDVKFKRLLPDTLCLTIEEHPAVALLPGGDTFWEIDGNGTVLARTDSISGKRLPIITGADIGLVGIGEALASEHIVPVLRCLQTKAGKWKEELAEINIGAAGDLTFYTVDGTKIMLGQASDDIDIRLALLEPLLADITATGTAVSHIDLRLPDKPIVRTK